jgi:hypothetical protein
VDKVGKYPVSGTAGNSRSVVNRTPPIGTNQSIGLESNSDYSNTKLLKIYKIYIPIYI